jgi:phosphoglycolate phosphatase-like HAD superfamily hydrolase
LNNGGYIKAIIFDFDGVILESADIKTEAFKELFLDYPERLKEIVDYHLANAGISRYIKFRYIYEQFLGQRLLKNKESELGKHFSKIVLDKILVASFVPGAKEFLGRNKNHYKFFIASGTPEEELHEIVCARRLQNYFKGIYGSPKNKRDIICHILDTHNLAKDEVVYVGDAQSDRRAAEQVGIVFIERNINSNFEDNPYVIRDLFGLSEVLKKIKINP